MRVCPSCRFKTLDIFCPICRNVSDGADGLVKTVIQDPTCGWEQVDSQWVAACDWSFFDFQYDNTPIENGFRYCPRCGHRLELLSPLSPREVVEDSQKRTT